MLGGKWIPGHRLGHVVVRGAEHPQGDLDIRPGVTSLDCGGQRRPHGPVPRDSAEGGMRWEAVVPAPGRRWAAGRPDASLPQRRSRAGPTLAGPGLGGRRECGRWTLFVLTL